LPVVQDVGRIAGGGDRWNAVLARNERRVGCGRSGVGDDGADAVEQRCPGWGGRPGDEDVAGFNGREIVWR
jgi:hypothetical protein